MVNGLIDVIWRIVDKCWKKYQHKSLVDFILKLDVLPVRKGLVKCRCLHDVHQIWYHAKCVCYVHAMMYECEVYVFVRENKSLTTAEEILGD